MPSDGADRGSVRVSVGALRAASASALRIARCARATVFRWLASNQPAWTRPSRAAQAVSATMGCRGWLRSRPTVVIPLRASGTSSARGVLRRPRRHGHALGYCYYDDGVRRRSVNKLLTKAQAAACRSTSTSYRRCCGKPDLREMTCQPQHKHPVGGQRSLPAHVTWETVIATSGPVSRAAARAKARATNTRTFFMAVCLLYRRKR
jgi:hypothetical protein